jgi:hypothetical protein
MKIIVQNTTVVPKFLTPKLVAGRWYRHVETVRKDLRNGKIPSVVIGRRRLVPLAAIEKLEQEGMVNATNSGILQ